MEVEEEKLEDNSNIDVEVNNIEGFSILESSAPPAFIDQNAPPLIPDEPTPIFTSSSSSNLNQSNKRKRMTSIIQPNVVADALKSLSGRGSIEEIISWMSFNFPEFFGDFSSREMVKVYSQIGKIICKNKLWFSLELNDEARSQKGQSITAPAKGEATIQLPVYEQTNCEVCRNGENEDQLLLCDGCDSGFHMYCLVPTLEKIPEGPWYCKKCQSNRDENYFPPKKGEVSSLRQKITQNFVNDLQL